MRTPILTLLALGLAVSSVRAAPDPAPFVEVFERYNRALLAGQVEQALGLRSAASRAEIEPAVGDPGQREDTLRVLRAMVPQQFTVEHLELGPDGETATLHGVATLRVDSPGQPRDGQELRRELGIGFVREGDWKLDLMSWGADVDAIGRSADERAEPSERYDRERAVSMGGRIVRVVFETDHTLVVLRVADEDQLAYLPSRDELEQAGFDTSQLVPWRILEVEGYPHATNPYKTLATGATLR